MLTRALLGLVLGFLLQGDAAAQLPVAAGTPAVTLANDPSCLGTHAFRTAVAQCGQIAAAGRLRMQPESLPSNRLTPSIGPVGKGALVGLGIGAGLGVIAALVAAQGCEENESRCTVVLILGGGAVGAGIGAAAGAVAGKD
jgi:hypothetical protein